MLERLAEALNRLLAAAPGQLGSGTGGATRPPAAGGGGGQGPFDGGSAGGRGGCEDADGPVENITYRDCAVEVNIQSDCEGEISVNEKTRECVRRLRDACEAYLNDEGAAGELHSALGALGATGDFAAAAVPRSASTTSGGDVNAADSGGGRPPFVTVQINVTHKDD